jgi:probable HAF family extracellular repeat protein
MYAIHALSGPADPDSEACAINATGAVAGLVFEPSLVGAIWSNGAWAPSFLMAAGSESILYGINDAGHAVGVEGFDNSPTSKAVLVQGGVVTDLSPHVGVGSLATDINNLGRICVWRGSAPHSFVFDSSTNAILAQIPPLPGATTVTALAINQAGDVVGTSGDTPPHGFVYSSSGALRDLGPAGFVEDINDSGQVCGSIGKPWPQAWAPGIWDISQSVPALTEILPPPGFLGAHGQGINNKGEVVGTCWTSQTYDSDQSAYIFSGGVSTDLNTLIPSGSGWHLEFAEAINDNGYITGTGYLNGQHRAFVLTPAMSEPNLPYPPHQYPSAELVALLIFGGVTVDGGGTVVLPGGPPRPVGPWGPAWAKLPAAKRDALVGLALDELATHITDTSTREAIRRPILEGVRRHVDQLLETPQAGAAELRPRARAGARRLQSGKLPSTFARFGRRPQQ